ncbi:MAG: tyrosine-type recombinase/integrase [Firmicutes bacterium]|jgi:integrase/recombinase XerC|nr:tyrosine-type recombinase/integrase [Bacillota bacterium]
MSTYHEQQKISNTIRLRAILEESPYFLGEFFRNIANTTSIKTRVVYAYDLKIFFTYITQHHKKLKGMAFEDMKSDCLNDITIDDIEDFLEYLTYYQKPDPLCPEQMIDIQNDAEGKARKLSAIRSMYNFFYKKQKVKSNPAAIVDSPKIHNKQIIRLEADEVANLLDLVENCDTDAMSNTQKAHIAHAQKRDLALISLLLGTGMRVSECVGIDIDDIDFRNSSVKVTRKGGNESTLYFNDEVEESLLDYITQREHQKNKSEQEKALFLSNRGTRITIRAVQNIVKKYARIISPSKKISPHKLRSTYATSLYKETGDIYLVADALGHADINTTKKHYAAMEESRRRSASKYVKLRKD